MKIKLLNIISNTTAPVWLDERTANRHVIISGQSGSGKSQLLAKLIMQQQLALSTVNVQSIVNSLPIALPVLLRNSKENAV